MNNALNHKIEKLNYHYNLWVKALTAAYDMPINKNWHKVDLEQKDLFYSMKELNAHLAIELTKNKGISDVVETK